MLVHKNLTYLSKEEVTDGVVSISKFLETKSPSRPANSKFDWDKSPICLMYTTRNGQSRVVKHTNKSITAQVFSPKGTSNHWFDQVLNSISNIAKYTQKLQIVGDCIFCGNWFFHFTGFHSFSLSAIHGLTMYFLSEYSDNDLLTALADLAISNAVLYPWQVWHHTHVV